MPRSYQVGDVVQVRLFNTPEQKFYGPVFHAEIIEIGTHKAYESPRAYKINRPLDGGQFYPMWIAHKEIKRRIR